MPGRRWITLVPFRCRCQNHRPCCQSSACAWQLLFRHWFVVSTLKTTITVSPLGCPERDFGAAFFLAAAERRKPLVSGRVRDTLVSRFLCLRPSNGLCALDSGAVVA